MNQEIDACITLICCTINPSITLIFLESLRKTNCKYKVIIINSSKSEFKLKELDEIIKRNILIYSLPNASLSEARNFALTKVKENCILAFPDDDCEYPIGLLDVVLETYKRNIDKNCIGISFDFPGRKENLPAKIFKNNIFGSCISFNFFLFNPKKIFFNEKLGIGGMFEFGEETDLLARNLTNGKYLINSSNYNIEHPIKIGKSFKRSFRRGVGIGGFVILTWGNKFNIKIKLKLLFGGFVRSLDYFVKAKYIFSLDSLINQIGRMIGLFKGLIFISHKRLNFKNYN